MTALVPVILMAAGIVVVLILFAEQPRGRWEFLILILGLGLVIVLLALNVPRSLRPSSADKNTGLASDAAGASPIAVTIQAEQGEPTATTQAAATAGLSATPQPQTPPPIPPSITPLATPRVEPAATPTAQMVPPTETAANVSPTPDQTATFQAMPAVTAIPTPSVITSTVKALGGNVRSSPALGNNVIGLVQQGDELVILGVRDDWYLVGLGTKTAPGSNIPGGQGWVRRGLINEPSQPPPLVP